MKKTQTSPFTHVESAQTTAQSRPAPAASPGFTTPAIDQPAEYADVDPQVVFSQADERAPRTAPVPFDPTPGFTEPC